jgi:transposase
MALEGSTTKEVFEAYLEQVLLPELEEGQVLIMDKLPAHKRAKVRELIEGRGLQLLYLPSYSPDYNPIEEAFSKVKQILRRACARTREALLEALGEALSAVSFWEPRDSSSTPVTILWVNYYEICCKSLSGAIEGLDSRRRVEGRERFSEWPEPIYDPRHACGPAILKNASGSRYRHHRLLPRRRGQRGRQWTATKGHTGGLS